MRKELREENDPDTALFAPSLVKAKKSKDRLTYLLATAVLIALVNCCGQTLIRYASISGTFIVLVALLSIKLEGGTNGGN